MDLAQSYCWLWWPHIFASLYTSVKHQIVEHGENACMQVLVYLLTRKLKYLLQDSIWSRSMARALLVTSTSSQRSSKACKFNERDRLSRITAQVNLRLVKLFCLSIAFNLPVLNIWVILRDLSTNAGHRSFYKWDSRGISSKLLKKNQQILCRLQPRPRNMVPEKINRD